MKKTIALVIALVALIPTTTFAEQRVDSAVPLSTKDLSIKLLIENRYAPIWISPSREGDISVRLYGTRDAVLSSTTPRSSIIIVTYPESMGLVSVTPVSTSAPFEGTALQTQWSLVLRTREGTVVTYGVDLGEPLRDLRRQSHAAYSGLPTRAYWVPQREH